MSDERRGVAEASATIFEGQAWQARELPGGFAELVLDLPGESVNKLSAPVVAELRRAVDALRERHDLKGLLLSSGKESFVVGADVTEFLGFFKLPDEAFRDKLAEVHRTFADLEDLPLPIVAAIRGACLGGGLELALAAGYRVASSDAKLGLPETKLGIFPGWGGTVRLPRVAGADTAIEWIAGGETFSAAEALKVGVVDGVVPADQLREAALAALAEAAAGRLDWRARQAEKRAALKLSPTEAGMVFEGSKAFVAGKAGPHYPAPVAAIEAMQKGAGKGREEALAREREALVKVAKGTTAAALVAVFLGDQWVKKAAKKASQGARPVGHAAVLGAGIMGGGIAYQSAVKGVPILMKDIAPKQLDLGMSEAAKLLERQVERGKLSAGELATTVARIRPTLSYGDFAAVDVVVEAVVENENVKKRVLAEVESQVKPDCIVASNTSTISISRLAEALARPENFCGMHFFNPVHRMPLVEVIRGARSSREAIATVVAWAQAMGKTPVVVGDCAGFLVNRVLFPYFAGFSRLVADGVDFARIDKVMERWGWPMGPALLLDVVGIDTAHHADAVMAAAFPERMATGERTVLDAMYEAGRYGQKNGLGFWSYKVEKKGPPKKAGAAPEAVALTRQVATGAARDIGDEEIALRMMLPMLLESSRCLEEGIVASPAEVDIALVYGLGFPPFRGGIFRWADAVGAADLLAACERHAALGPLYGPTQQLADLARAGKGFHPSH